MGYGYNHDDDHHNNHEHEHGNDDIATWLERSIMRIATFMILRTNFRCTALVNSIKMMMVMRMYQKNKLTRERSEALSSWLP